MKTKSKEPTISKIKFSDLKTIEDLAIVILGAGGELQEWVDGIRGSLIAADIISANQKTFKFAAKVEGNINGTEGRTDLVLVFDPASSVNVSKLAMWRLAFGDVSWLEDFVVNYRKDYQKGYQKGYRYEQEEV